MYRYILFLLAGLVAGYFLGAHGVKTAVNEAIDEFHRTEAAITAESKRLVSFIREKL